MGIILDGTNGISTPDVEPTGSTVPTNGVYLPAANSVGIATNSSERVRVDSSGNVGIGTSSPSFSTGSGLQVNRAGTSNIRISNSTTGLATELYQTDTTTGFSIDARGTNNFTRFLTDGTERARIDSSGNLLVGTTGTTPVQSNTAGAFAYRPTAQLEVNGNATQAAFFGRTNDGMVVGFYSGGTRRGSVDISGSTTSYVTSSDYRLKENVQPITGALAKVALLQPSTYIWKEDGKTGEGFIAHELQEVCPQAVTGEKDAVDAEGNPVYQGIDTSFLVATLAAAIQEQQAIIEQLTTRIAALEAK